MLEMDWLAVGDGEKSGDAIAARFTRADTGALAHIVVDAGFKDDGKDVVAVFDRYYGTRTVDLAILTHPDGDHIGGMGDVVRELDVAVLCIHRLGARGGSSLPAAKAVHELITLAESRGTRVVEPFAGDHAFGGALTFVGPDERYYAEMVAEQVAAEGLVAKARGALLEAKRSLSDRFAMFMPGEIPFDEGEGTGPRNNTSVITLLEVGSDRMLLTGDAGVPALERALNWMETNGRNGLPLDFVQVPHHGSRRNASSALLDRLLGPIGQVHSGEAIVSVVPDAPKHPSGRVINAYARRGFPVTATAGRHICHFGDGGPGRPGWGPVDPLGPMDEGDDD